MSVLEIVLVALGVILSAIGYAYNKTGEAAKKKANIPENYTEYIGICKKHNEKDGRFYAEYEIVHDGKTLKYETKGEDSKDDLAKIESIEKFYIDDKNPKVIKTVDDFKNKNAKLDPKRQKTSYIVMGVGIVLLVVTLFMIAF